MFKTRERLKADLVKFTSYTLSLLAFASLVKFLWPESTPFDVFQFWNSSIDALSEAIPRAWPVYLWGAGMTALVCVLTRNPWYRKKYAENHFLVETRISIVAGVTEEILFRWLLFLCSITIVTVVDWLLLGFLGLHWIRWIYADIVCPIANFFTLGYLEPYLMGGYGWAVGAAIISANGEFRNGHAYLGFFGFVNSWFLGMYFFWVMFVYGLPAAIIVHFLYDFLIFAVHYVDAVVERHLER